MDSLHSFAMKNDLRNETLKSNNRLKCMKYETCAILHIGFILRTFHASVTVQYNNHMHFISYLSLHEQEVLNVSYFWINHACIIFRKQFA